MQTDTQKELPINYDRKYKWNKTHKAISIIHEMYDRNASVIPEEIVATYKTACSMYWLALYDSINITNMEELRSARLSILGLNVDSNIIPPEDNKAHINWSWQYLTNVPWEEWVNHCIDLWREIDAERNRKRLTNGYLYALGEVGSAAHSYCRPWYESRLDRDINKEINHVSEKKLMNGRLT